MDISEIAPPAAGDENLLAQTVGMFQDSDTTSAPSGLYGAHQSRRAAAENQSVKGMDHGNHR